MSDVYGSWRDNNFNRDDKRRSSLFYLDYLRTTKMMNFTMFEGFFQILATGGMVISGCLFVLGVIYAGYERILLR